MPTQPRGLWIWRLNQIAADYLAKLAACGCGRVYLKVVDGGSLLSQCTTTNVGDFKSKGIEVFGWGYHYVGDDGTNDATAVEKALACGLDGYVLDIEKEAFDPANHPNVSSLIAKVRPLLNGKPLAYSSFGDPQYQGGMPWQILNEGTDFCLPQIYYEMWHFAPTPQAIVDQCIAANRALPGVKDILPIWGSEAGAPHPATNPLLQNLLDQYHGSSVWRAPQGAEAGLAWQLKYDNP